MFYALKNKSINRTDMIYENIKIKAAVVSNDEEETKGERIKLNFGHTIGHAIEKYYNFSGITHGCAVSIGMIYAAKISYLLGLCDYDVIKEIKEILNIYKLPASIGIGINIDNKLLAKYCTADKKSESSNIQFVLLTEIGKCTVQKIAIENLQEFLCKCDEIEV
jgi:3-dehydroquinate synthase